MKMDGALSTETWDAGTQATWTARMLNGLYLALPSIVNNNDRLIAWLLGVLGLQADRERGYRCPFSEDE